MKQIVKLKKNKQPQKKEATDKTDLNTDNKSEDVTWTTEEEQKEESVKVPKTDNAEFQDKLESEKPKQRNI